MSDDDHSPISALQAKRLFADWKTAPAIVLAVSGGPDSLALMWLAARWRKTLRRGPHLVAVTVDHCLRPASAREAREVKRLAAALDVPHRILRWTGPKPKTGLPAAARAERYRLLAKAARDAGASHILTAHTRDDQAETLLMRLLRGSGLAGLAAMIPETDRNGVRLARPFLQVAKSQLMATLAKANIDFADDPTNRDMNFTRPRLRALMPQLAAEGGDARNLTRLASRLARANEALEILADGAERYLALLDGVAPGRKVPSQAVTSFHARAFAGMPEEVRLRLLLRAVSTHGHEGPPELGKAETLLAALDRAMLDGVRVAATPPKAKSKGKSTKTNRTRVVSSGMAPKQTPLRQTLAGALISLQAGAIRIEAAPARRGPLRGAK